MVDQAGQGISKREILIFFYKYRTRLFLSFLIPLALAIALSYVPSPVYKAESVLIVRLGSEYIYQAETGAGTSAPASVIPLSNDQIFKSEVAILSSDDLHAKVISTIGLDNIYPEFEHPSPMNLAIHNFKARMSSLLEALGLPKPKKKIVTGDRKLAQAVDIFDRHLDILLEKESAVITLTFEHKDSEMAQRALQTLLNAYFEKRKALYIDPRAERAQEEMRNQQKGSRSANLAIEDYKRKHNIYSLADQRTELLQLRSVASQQAIHFTSPELTQKIATYNEELDQLDAEEKDLNNLQHEADIKATAYNLYASKYDEAKSYEAQQIQRVDGVRVIQPPLSPAEPKGIQTIIILGGFVGAIFLTMLVAVLTEFSKNGFLTPEQLERRLGLPVLAVVPLGKRR